MNKQERSCGSCKWENDDNKRIQRICSEYKQSDECPEYELKKNCTNCYMGGNCPHKSMDKAPCISLSHWQPKQSKEVESGYEQEQRKLFNLIYDITRSEVVGELLNEAIQIALNEGRRLERKYLMRDIKGDKLKCDACELCDKNGYCELHCHIAERAIRIDEHKRAIEKVENLLGKLAEREKGMGRSYTAEEVQLELSKLKEDVKNKEGK